MPEQTAHPSHEQLSAYNLGQLPPDEAVAIETHISDCEPCCETIIGLSSDDTFIGLLKEARQLPADQTVDVGATAATTSAQEVPAPLAEHPRYEILGLIGKGGMGDVYKATHRKMERTVALKVINRGLVRKTEVVDRFHREVKAAAQLSHPNIVTAFDADQADDFHFMVMEYVDGVDLSQTVKDRGELPVAEACEYIRQAAIGLQHAHEQGMVHRDIKPHNLMVTADGTVKVLDFGLASLAPEARSDTESGEVRSDLTAAGAIMGTPDFISPEQAEDARQADIRSDIYSLGATLYFLLSGRVPFADGSVMHKLRSHAQVEPAPLSSVRDDVPEKLVAIASKMMAKDPDERYLTPKEVAEALESFLRTWQPGEENSPRKDASNGGDDSGSGRQRHTADDSNPSRLPMVAKFLLYTSLLPIGLSVVNEFVPLGLFSGETDWFWYCLLTSIALSTIGGIMLGVHQGMSNIRDGQRINGMTTGQTALIILILAVSAFGILNHMSDGKWHLEVTPQSDRMTLGTHPLTIVNTSGEKPFGGTHRTHKDKTTGITTRSFESANGRYKITLVDKVLTVNGEKYTLENPTDAILIVDDRVEITKVTSLPDGERFNSKALPDDVKVQQILDRMAKVYAECKSYRDSGVIKSVFHKKTASPEFTVEHSFTTAFERPDRFRFEIKDQYDDELLISLDGEEVQTSWDIEPGFPKPESLELAMAQAVGFTGGDVGRIPAMLMPKQLDGWVDLNLIDPIQIEDGKLQNVECFRLQYNFRDEQITLWIDKQSHLVRRIDEWLKSDDVSIERTTTYDPTIDGKITDEMLEFDPPAPQAADDGANTLPGSALGGNDSPPPPAQERDADAATQKAGQQRSDNQFGMPLCWCPAGEFQMGRKQLPVTLTRGFWMAKYEVTQAQYEALMGENPSENKGESLPVEKVEWTKAKKFCQKFTELERKAGRLPKGWEYRLPTEAQWEYACRAGTTLIWDDEKELVYPSTFGDDLSELGDYAWYSENSDGTPHPVGQKKPNAWGLCDMHGNVREWVRDAWQSKLSGGKDPEVDVSFPIHARRGGDWLSSAEPCGSPFIRGFVVGGREVPHMMGFRVALVSVDDSGDGATANVNTEQEARDLLDTTSESGLGDVDQYERLFQLRILLMKKSRAILESIVDEATAEKAAASWRDLFPIQVEAEYLEGRLVEFRELDDRRSESRRKYGPQVEDLRRRLLERQAICQKLPFFQKVNKAQQEYSEDLLSVKAFEIQHGHAWRANGPQFVIWFLPRVIPEIDLSREKGTLEVLIVDEETGALSPQREHIQCGGKAVLPIQDDKNGCLYWLRPVQTADEKQNPEENSNGR
ncbi:MAG: SUMF1/EgtB/PvdO family nonheme iron enzyme [Planctomycetota bacterium]|nr:SUMF1/EgtB/PvdO family nonheme iron enzyme [Planctomycetota bacterium]